MHFKRVHFMVHELYNNKTYKNLLYIILKIDSYRLKTSIFQWIISIYTFVLFIRLCFLRLWELRGTMFLFTCHPNDTLKMFSDILSWTLQGPSEKKNVCPYSKGVFPIDGKLLDLEKLFFSFKKILGQIKMDKNGG